MNPRISGIGLVTAACGGIVLVTSTTNPSLAQQPAEAYPSRPVRIIVPFAPGGNNDTAARVVSRQLSMQLGQQFVVDNRPGAGGTTGTHIVATAPADGYTLGVGFVGTLAINPHIFEKLPYDALKDFTAIGRIADAPNLLAVHPSIPAKSLSELVAYAKANPGRLSYGTGGVGTVNHLAGELLSSRAGIRLQHIPFKGSAQAVIEVVGGNIEMIFAGPPSIAPYSRSGRLRTIAITTLKRSSAFPEIPTIAESGYPGFQAIAWIGIVGPAGLPRARVDMLNKAIGNALAADDVRKIMDANGFESAPSSSAAFAEFIRTEYATWGKLIRQLKIRAP